MIVETKVPPAEQYATRAEVNALAQMVRQHQRDLAGAFYRIYILERALGIALANNSDVPQPHTSLDALAARLAHVERLLHRAVNAGCVDDYGEEVVSVSGTGMGIYATRRATPPLTAAERAELETLRAFKGGVPWKAIRESLDTRYTDPSVLSVVQQWLAAHAPQEYESSNRIGVLATTLDEFITIYGNEVDA